MATIVLCSYVIRYPVGGVLSSNLQFLTGFRSLGHDVYLVEKAGYPNSCFDPRIPALGEDCAHGMATIDRLLREHGLAGRWCYVSADGTYYGLTKDEVERVFSRTDVFIDRGLHGTWDGESAEVECRVLIDPDPGYRQIQMEKARRRGESLPIYDYYYTYGQNIGAGSPAPTAGIDWRHIFHPVDTDLFKMEPMPAKGSFTTVMNWQSLPTVDFEGVEYGMKDVEFSRFRDLPALVSTPLKVAVEGSGFRSDEFHDIGWSFESALEATSSLNRFTEFIRTSLGEFSVAKHVYVAMRVGWFSDRSAAYLAHGRPVVIQDTGIQDHLPLGDGLHAVDTAQEASRAIETIAEDPDHHAAAARSIAEEYLATSVVLPRFLEEIGFA